MINFRDSSHVDNLFFREEVAPSIEIEEIAVEPAPKKEFSFRNVLFDVLMCVTIIPLLVKIYLERQKERKSGLLVKELEEIKWRGLFNPGTIDSLIASAKTPEHFQKKATQFISQIQDIDPSIQNDIRNGDFLKGFKALKKHQQIASFYKAYSQRVNVQQTEEMQKIADLSKTYIESPSKASRSLANKKISVIRSGLMINSWLDTLHARGEMDPPLYQTLMANIDSGDNSSFISNLKKFVQERAEACKAEGPNMGTFFYSELWNSLVAIDSNTSIKDLGDLFMPLFFYQDLYKKLERVESSIEPNMTEDQLKAVQKIMKENQTLVMGSIATDVLFPPVLDYQFRALAGQIKRKFTDINDALANSHHFCGCHHSTSTPQVVDVVKSRLNLEKKLSQTTKPKKSEILQRDINALKESEKGILKNKNGKKSVVLGITCNFGGGHKAATAAVAKIIGNEEAHFSAIDVPDEIKAPLTTLYRFCKFFGYELKDSDCYNKLIIQKNWVCLLKIASVLNAISNIFPREKNVPEKELIRKRLLMEMPDHLMTFYHMDLPIILQVAEEMGIPTTHFATDFNIKMEEVFGKEVPKHPEFKVVTCSDSKETLASAFPVKPEDVIVSSGAVRPLFLTKTDEAVLAKMREERGIDEHTRTILFMGGGFGRPIEFPEKLANSQFPQKLHLMVVAGGNKEFGDSFEELAKKGVLKKEGKFYKGSNPGITIEVAKDPAMKTKGHPYFIGESAMSRYFDLADVLYTKPGGSTTLEALAKGITVLFDGRGSPLSWEKENMEQTIALGNGLENFKTSEFMNDLSKACALSEKNEKKPRDLPSIAEIIHLQNPSDWQKDKSAYYRLL